MNISNILVRSQFSNPFIIRLTLVPSAAVENRGCKDIYFEVIRVQTEQPGYSFETVNAATKLRTYIPMYERSKRGDVLPLLAIRYQEKFFMIKVKNCVDKPYKNTHS